MAALLQDIGAENFVTAVVNDPEDWSLPGAVRGAGAYLFSMLDEIEGVTAAHGVRQVVHPHADTLIQTVGRGRAVPAVLVLGHVPRHRSPRRGGRRSRGHRRPVRLAYRPRAPEGCAHRGRRSLQRRRAAGDAAVQAASSPRSATATSRSRRPSPPSSAQGDDGLYVLEQDVAITDGEPVDEGPVRNVAKNVALLRSLDAS